METVSLTAELRKRVQAWRMCGERVALVPTMGNLHPGHAQLVKRATELADRVVVSVFVNPLQFGPSEDYEQYPRTPEDDRRVLARYAVDLVFAPSVDEMYPQGLSASTVVDVPELSGELCGAFRPGHFRGVATVVTKLFNLVQPDMALFGEKDYQQLTIIRRLSADLCMPLQIVGVPTVREADGLAMSSRNRYLSREERSRAPRIHQTLQSAAQLLKSGSRDFAAIERAGSDQLVSAGFKPDYFSVRDAMTLQAPTGTTSEFIVLTAARLGKARLIDNVKVGG